MQPIYIINESPRQSDRATQGGRLDAALVAATVMALVEIEDLSCAEGRGSAKLHHHSHGA
jgi:hypothetical protein